MISLTDLLQIVAVSTVPAVPLLAHGHPVPQVPLLSSRPGVPQVPLVLEVPLVTQVPLVIRYLCCFGCLNR